MSSPKPLARIAGLLDLAVGDFGDFGARMHTLVAVIPPTIAEVGMVLYLLVKGVRAPAAGTPSVGTTVTAEARV